MTQGEAREAMIEGSLVKADQERRERALRALGRFRSGKRDVGERHDKYLAEAYGK